MPRELAALVWKFCLYLLISSVGLIGVAWGSPYGQFGWGPPKSFLGFELKPDGLRAQFSRSDALHFGPAFGKWIKASCDGVTAEYNLITAGTSPTKVRLNELATGPEYYFQRGLRLEVSSLQAPLLSWADGSVDREVPAPHSPWIAISFADSQPPILAAFMGQTPSLVVRGKPGAWTIESADEAPYQGWVRFSLPLGLKALTTVDAASLGLLVTQIQRDQELWSVKNSARLVQRTIQRELTGLTATYKFSGPYAVVPPAAVLAARGGYGVQVLSPVRDADATLLEGPQNYVIGDELRLFFPFQRLPGGRAVALGSTKPTQAPKSDAAAIFQNCLRTKFSDCPAETVKDLRARLTKFLSDHPYQKLPLDSRSVPFSADGKGVDAVAFAAFIESCLEPRTAQMRPLMTSLSWSLGFRDWRLRAPDARTYVRAQSIASLAGALHGSLEANMFGAQLNAGLAAQKGLAIYLKREPEHVPSPVAGFRNSLFSSDPPKSFLAQALLSPLRMISGPVVVATQTGETVNLSWDAANLGPAKIKLVSPVPLVIRSSDNLATAELMTGPTPLELILTGLAAKPGKCTVKLGCDTPIPALPKAVKIIYFEE